MLPPKHHDEEARLAALRRYGILDTADEPAFNDLTRLASAVCETPVAVINLIDRDRQWFKSEVGLGVRQTPLDTSLCAHAILQPGLMVVPDTLEDGRFACNPLVTGEPHLRFYAGALLETPDGLPLGTLCVLDHRPRRLTERQEDALRVLARQAMALIELRATAEGLRASEARLQLAMESAALGAWEFDPATGVTAASDRVRSIFGAAENEAPGEYWFGCLHPDDRGRVEAEFREALTGARPYDTEYRVLWRDGGGVRWVRARGRLLAAGGRLLGVAEDITARKEAEERLARYAREQADVAGTLQRSLLLVPPEDAFPGVSVGVLYQAASREALVGGDFCDVFAVADGRVALVVGDVTGKGLRAATYTAEIKFALRAFLRESPNPARALYRLNHYLIEGQRLDPSPHGEFVALSVAVLDTETGEMQCAAAGAEPPLIVRAAGGGTAEVVEASGPLVGVDADSDFESVTATLGPGDVFALTTDGITEARQGRRGSDLFGYERFARATAEAAAEISAAASKETPSLRAAARAVMAEALAFAGGDQSDDVCLLLARREPREGAG